jgi:hypothetical protein
MAIVWRKSFHDTQDDLRRIAPIMRRFGRILAESFAGERAIKNPASNSRAGMGQIRMHGTGATPDQDRSGKTVRCFACET